MALRIDISEHTVLFIVLKKKKNVSLLGESTNRHLSIVFYLFPSPLIYFTLKMKITLLCHL